MDNLAKIKELQKQINAMNVVIEDLITSEMKQQHNSPIDIKRIEQLGKQVPFQSHFVSFLDEDVAIKYCTLLASAVRLLEDIEKKIRQYYFIARILHSSKVRCSLEEIITNAELVDISDFESIKQELREDIKVFLFDLLLQISFDGKMEEKQLDYFCEVLAYTGISEKEIRSIFRVVSCVLLEKIEELFENSGNFPIEKVCPYFNNFETVTSVEGIFKVKKENIIVVGVKEFKRICSTEKVAVRKNENKFFVGFEEDIEEKIIYHLLLDELKKKNIIFFKCIFENLADISEKRLKVRFEKCSFNRCEYFSFAEAIVNECYFEKCGMLEMKLGQIKNCIFNECSRTIYTQNSGQLDIEQTALIYLQKGLIYNCECNQCNVMGEKNSSFWRFSYNGYKLIQTLNIIYLNSGTIERCRFLECKCKDLKEDRSYSGYSSDNVTKKNYLINLIQGIERNNTFERCVATKNVGTARWESE